MGEAPITRAARGVTLRLDEIEFQSTVRPYNATAVGELARSIAAIGLQSAPTVIERGGRHVLVAGRHRIEALRVLGVESVLVRAVDFDDLEARLWTISENLHRTELTELQRSQQIAEYASLIARKQAAEAVSAQVAQKLSAAGRSGEGRPEGGNSLIARGLGISRDEVRRAKAIAGLSEAARQEAAATGLDDNQSALLQAAQASTPEAQVAALHDIRERGRVSAVKPLRNLENIAAGELARWIKLTTPNDRPHVIHVLETAAAILRDEMERADG